MCGFQHKAPVMKGFDGFFVVGLDKIFEPAEWLLE